MKQFKKYILTFGFCLAVIASCELAQAGDEHGHEVDVPQKAQIQDKHEDSHSDKHDEHQHEDEHGHGREKQHDESSTISSSAAKALEIEVSNASEAIVQERLSVAGRVTLNQNTTAQVKARFPGIIRSVLKQPGETVKAGEILATVESNDSLQVYPVKSPVAGTVITRQANIGELASDQPLFAVADLNMLWGELFVFSKDVERVKAGADVTVKCLSDPITAQTTIALILPTAESSSQTTIVRANIDNTDRHWRSGMSIQAHITVSQKRVPIAVKTEALQRMENKTVVFLALPDGKYQARPVVTGMSDPQWTEIKEGIMAGQAYVSKNSFIVKADIGKAGAEHEH